MQQIKIFKTIEPEVESLEKEINNWIKESKVRVLSVVGNIAPQSSAADPKAVTTTRGFAPSDVLVIVVYETT
jgi:hypothetical protein